jgi:hypothetical protein
VRPRATAAARARRARRARSEAAESGRRQSCLQLLRPCLPPRKLHLVHCRPTLFPFAFHCCISKSAIFT